MKLTLWKILDIVLLFAQPLVNASMMHNWHSAYCKGWQPFAAVVFVWVFCPIACVAMMTSCYNRITRDEWSPTK